MSIWPIFIALLVVMGLMVVYHFGVLVAETAIELYRWWTLKPPRG